MTKARSTRGIQGDTACPAICGHTGRAEEGPRAKAASKGRGGGNQKEGESRGEAFSPSDGVKTRRVAERRKTQTVRESERREKRERKGRERRERREKGKGDLPNTVLPPLRSPFPWVSIGGASALQGAWRTRAGRADRTQCAARRRAQGGRRVAPSPRGRARETDKRGTEQTKEKRKRSLLSAPVCTGSASVASAAGVERAGERRRPGQWQARGRGGRGEAPR